MSQAVRALAAHLEDAEVVLELPDEGVALVRVVLRLHLDRPVKALQALPGDACTWPVIVPVPCSWACLIYRNLASQAAIHQEMLLMLVCHVFPAQAVRWYILPSRKSILDEQRHGLVWACK